MNLKPISYFLLIPVLAAAAEQAVNPEEIKDYTEESGIGCTQSIPGKEELIHIVCKSKISAQSAWNASMYRAKYACESQLFSMFFNKPPRYQWKTGYLAPKLKSSAKRGLNKALKRTAKRCAFCSLRFATAADLALR